MRINWLVVVVINTHSPSSEYKRVISHYISPLNYNNIMQETHAAGFCQKILTKS